MKNLDLIQRKIELASLTIIESNARAVESKVVNREKPIFLNCNIENCSFVTFLDIQFEGHVSEHNNTCQINTDWKYYIGVYLIIKGNKTIYQFREEFFPTP